MRVFERASTGLSGLDKILDQLRMGDNVVWQVDSIDDYRYFVQYLVQQGLKEKRKIIYMRFGQHPEVIPAQAGVKVYRLDANAGFEAFSAEVHNIATAEGEGAYYIFDCLSDLLSAWATDLMIGNFFKVTCPYLFELNTIAYFTVLRNRNSYQTIARIRETTQLMLDVYHNQDRFYIHPLKVWNRYSPTMFLPHIGAGNDFIPITSSGEAAYLFTTIEPSGPYDAGRKLDYWDRVFIKAREIIEGVKQGDPLYLNQEKDIIEQLCKMMIGRDERVLQLAREYFNLQDLLNIRTRLIGSGFIGGKAVGMLLARSILKRVPDNYWSQWLEPHDSFYVGSDVFYTYLVENDCWNLRLEQKNEPHYFSAAQKLRARIISGILPDAIRDQFQQMLEYFGQSPIIVRSSSLLEDSFGNAFAGKYESMFCVNQGTLQERYNRFEEAVKKVFASTMSQDALAYRLQRGLAGKDEQMALLVQRVSGSNRNRYFFPDLAGVAMSHNLYVWKEDMDPRAGMVRLVAGLGTRAVDRVEDDYPRVIPLDQPKLRPETNLEDIRRFSQRKVDVLDIFINNEDTVSLADISGLIKPDCWKLMAVNDYETTRKMKELGYQQAAAYVLTFENLLTETPFPSIMQRMLRTLEAAYHYPVDIEFTVNFTLENRMQINLLQCRPLQTWISSAQQAETNVDGSANIFLSTRGNFMGGTISKDIKRIIYVYPDAYSALSLSDKYEAARLVGKLNRLSAGPDLLPVMLIGPGRWGTSTPSLGIPVAFAEICNVSVLVETAGAKGSFMPEISYGTHFFQDLVESQIFYIALFPDRDEVIFNQEWLDEAPNSLTKLVDLADKWKTVVKVVDLTDLKQTLRLNANLETRQVTGCILPVNTDAAPGCPEGK